jgi:hypothetical protein
MNMIIDLLLFFFFYLIVYSISRTGSTVKIIDEILKGHRLRSCFFFFLLLYR